MKTAYLVNWDNGSHACGTFPQRFDTEAEAQAFADNWMLERNAEDSISQADIEFGNGYTAEVIEAEEAGEK